MLLSQLKGTCIGLKAFKLDLSFNVNRSKSNFCLRKGVGMTDFQFSDEQFLEIREIWRDINSQCKVLQERTGCPNSEIIKMIDSAKSYWENKR